MIALGAQASGDIQVYAVHEPVAAYLLRLAIFSLAPVAAAVAVYFLARGKGRPGGWMAFGVLSLAYVSLQIYLLYGPLSAARRLGLPLPPGVLATHLYYCAVKLVIWFAITRTGLFLGLRAYRRR